MEGGEISDGTGQYRTVVEPKQPTASISSSPTVTDDPVLYSVVAQSWISELQVVSIESCGGVLKTGQCWCVVSKSVAVGCVPEQVCVQNGWSCNSARDPDSEPKLQGLLQQHATQTLAAWAQTAGFALRYYQPNPADTNSSYKQRLVSMLSQCIDTPTMLGGYDEHGRLPDDVPLSAAYVVQHGCPANMYTTFYRYDMCVNCPHGKVAAPGATQESDCQMSPTSSLPNKIDHLPRRPETTGTPFPDCYSTHECELVLVDREQFDEPVAVLVKQPSPEQNRTDSAASSATWQVYIPPHTAEIA